MHNWIADRKFDLVDSSGKRFTIDVLISEPVTMPAEEPRYEYGRCFVSMEPFLPERSVGGTDRFQALCLAINYVRGMLKTFTAQGGRVFDVDDDTPTNLDDPSFCSHMPLWDPRNEDNDEG